jgi:hypothetical protein
VSGSLAFEQSCDIFAGQPGLVYSLGLRDGAGLPDSRRFSNTLESYSDVRISRARATLNRVLTTDSLSPRDHTAPARDLLLHDVHSTQGSALTIVATFLMKPLKLANP